MILPRCRDLARGLAIAAIVLAAQPTAAQSTASHPQIDSRLRQIVRSEGPRAKIIDKNVFYGDYDGDGQRDALAFAYYDAGEGGNSTYLKVAIFRGEKGGFRFVKIADDVYGLQPRAVRFGQGAIAVTTTMLGPNEARCCPTMPKRYVIRVD